MGRTAHEFAHCSCRVRGPAAPTPLGARKWNARPVERLLRFARDVMARARESPWRAGNLGRAGPVDTTIFGKAVIALFRAKFS